MKKLNLGSGSDYRKGYINIDSNPKFNPDKTIDVRKLIFEDDSIDEILARDILEHIPLAECEALLKDWHRMLKLNGKLIIQTPNLLTISEKIINGSFPTVITMVKRIFGGQDYSGNFHQNGFTPFTLDCLLKKIGFREIKVYPVKDLKTPDYDTNMVVEAIK